MDSGDVRALLRPRSDRLAHSHGGHKRQDDEKRDHRAEYNAILRLERGTDGHVSACGAYMRHAAACGVLALRARRVRSTFHNPTHLSRAERDF